MKNKFFKVFSLSILALVLLMSVASAATLAEWDFEDSDLIVDTGTGTLTISDARTATYPVGNAPSVVAAMSTTGWDVADRYIELDISTNGYDTITIKFDHQASGTGPTDFKIQYSSDGTTFTDLSGSTTSTVSAFTSNPMHTFNLSSITAINNNANAVFRIVVPASGVGSDSGGTFRIDNLLIEGSTYTEETPEEITACSLVGGGNLKVDITDIKVVKGFGDDEDWFPLDEIEVEVEIENKNNEEKIKDITIEWGLWSDDLNEWVIEMDDLDDFDLKKDSDKTITIDFKLNEKKLDIDFDELVDGEYTLYVIANGKEIEDPVCAMYSEPINMVIENDFVILDDIQVAETASCGDEVQITADVWNIGDEDQDEVYVIIYNKELGINQKVTIGDIDAFDNEKLNAVITMPKNTEEKQYDLIFRVYNDNSEIYENDYDDDQAEFFVPISVEGSCSTVPLVSVSASLESDAKAGSELIVKAIVINSGTKTSTYSLNVAGYADWASLTSIDKNSLTLDAGKSDEVYIKLKINDDVSGDKSFNIEVLDGAKVFVQPVSVTIESSSFPGLTGLFSGFAGDNWYIYGIGALNVLLVLVIIIVAVRVSKKKE